MSKHTPGPWNEYDGFLVGEGGFSICDPRLEEPTIENMATMDANAALIAAAPDLLAALREARGYVEAHSMALNDAGRLAASQDALRAWDAMNAAVARAEGK